MKALLTKATAVAILAMAVDQLTKGLARETLALCTAQGAVGCDRVLLAGLAELIRVRNAGSAFGFHQGLWIWVPIAIGGLALVLLYARAGKASTTIAVAAGLQVGGALGNLIDRLFLDGVTDFIYLGAGPVFNVADIALAVGTVLATWALARGREQIQAITTHDISGSMEPAN